MAISAALTLVLTLVLAPATGVGTAADGTRAADAAVAGPTTAAAPFAGSTTAAAPLAGATRGTDVRKGAWGKPAARQNRVVLVGDSLAQEVTPFLQFLTPGKTFVPKFWGGTAPCDWSEVNLEASRTSVVVITFTGNSLTDCMSDGNGSHLVDGALVEQYRYDIGVLIDRSRRAGARVVLIGQPLRDSSFEADVEVEGINEVYREFAAAYPFVSYVDAGRAVETPDGRFAERLPCTAYDVDCAEDGQTVVRGDGVHFCPIEGENPCTVWSSGAFRFALAIASAANNPRMFD